MGRNLGAPVNKKQKYDESYLSLDFGDVNN